jgi:hypothetical protein
MIASAIVDVCLEWGYDLEGSVRRLVTAAARKLQREGYAPKTGSIAYIASQIDDLPMLAIAAAQAAVDAVPSRLSYRTNLSAALRRNSQAAQASSVNALALPLVANSSNTDQCRPFFTEWGVVEGNLSWWARNAVLVGLSLQDAPSLGSITRDRSARAISCLLLAVKKLAEQNPTEELVEGVATITVIYRSIGPASNLAWLREAERFVDLHNARYPDGKDTGVIARSLRKTLIYARQNLEHPLPVGLPTMTWNFEGLTRLM